MKSFKVFITFAIVFPITCLAQTTLINKQDNFYSPLTNDSLKYWDFVSCSDTNVSKIGLCFNKNNTYYEYEYLKTHTRFFYNYMLDYRAIYSFVINNDTLYTSKSNIGSKIVYLSKDSLVLSYYSGCENKYLTFTYRVSEDQITKPEDW